MAPSAITTLVATLVEEQDVSTNTPSVYLQTFQTFKLSTTTFPFRFVFYLIDLLNNPLVFDRDDALEIQMPDACALSTALYSLLFVR